MPLPNFLIIGVEKGGTTSLYWYLKQHPEIFMCPVKEPNFLVYDPAHPRGGGPIKAWVNVRAKTLEEYMQLFEGVVDEKAIGEASPSNFSEFACDRARKYLPDARLIAVFRQPVEQAYARYRHRRRYGFDPENSFLTAYRASGWRRQHGWAGHLCYQNGAYLPVVEHWLSRFPRDQFKFYLYEDFKVDALSMLKDIFRFLEVDDRFNPDVSVQYNTAFGVRSPRLSHFTHPYSRNNPIRVILRRMLPQTFRGRVVERLDQWNHIPAVSLDPELRRRLTSELRDNILKLQDLIGRDLSHWLEN